MFISYIPDFIWIVNDLFVKMAAEAGFRRKHDREMTINGKKSCF